VGGKHQIYRGVQAIIRLTLTVGLLKNLKQEIPSYMRREYLPREAAYEKLKALTGQDFGYDTAKWEEWIKDQESQGVVFRVKKHEDTDSKRVVPRSA
jgi:hypothetical protein